MKVKKCIIFLNAVILASAITYSAHNFLTTYTEAKQYIYIANVKKKIKFIKQSFEERLEIPKALYEH